jgi:hypothetical protein
MRVKTVRPHRNDHENDQGKPGWKHTGTEYEHPDPAEDIQRGLIEPIGEVASEEEPVVAEDEREPDEPAKTEAPAKAPARKPSGQKAKAPAKKKGGEA